MKFKKIIILLIFLCAPKWVWSEPEKEVDWIEIAQSELIKART